MYISGLSFTPFRIFYAVDGEWGHISNFKRSVLFWLNFLLAKILKDRLETKWIAKMSYYRVSGKKQADVTGLEESKMTRSAPCKDIGVELIFFIARKINNVCQVPVIQNVLLVYFLRNSFVLYMWGTASF